MLLKRIHVLKVLSLGLVVLVARGVLPALGVEAASASALANNMSTACPDAGYSFLVFIENVRSGEGTITIDIHDGNPDAFLKPEGLVSRIRIPAVVGSTSACVGVDMAGTYALALYHDKNANLKFDKNWLGLPSEPYGISNDPPIRLGPPPHRLAAFEIFGPRTPVTVTLKN